jgi:hypothetical protein
MNDPKLLEFAQCAFSVNMDILSDCYIFLHNPCLVYTNLDNNTFKFSIEFRLEDKNMPAKSVSQQKLMAIAEHNPKAISKKNRGVLKMSHKQLHDFAATKVKKLPKKVKKK